MCTIVSAMVVLFRHMPLAWLEWCHGSCDCVRSGAAGVKAMDEPTAVCKSARLVLCKLLGKMYACSTCHMPLLLSLMGVRGAAWKLDWTDVTVSRDLHEWLPRLTYGRP